MNENEWPTEAEWLECKKPVEMLKFLEDVGKASERKLRLFAVASCRRNWASITDERSCEAVEIAERFADGQATQSQLASACENAHAVAFNADGVLVGLDAVWASFGPRMAAWTAVSRKAELLNPGWMWAAYPPPSRRPASLERPGFALNDIFGNPFRPVTIDPRWQSSTVIDLATVIYEERSFNLMPILADALMDAGCDSEEIIAHCRSEGPHVRGCWVVDLLLGKG